MTLASASERIKSMEQALGVPLLLRERLGVRPTSAGRTLAHHARLVLLQMSRLQEEMNDHGSGFAAHVRVLCNTSALSEHLPGVLSGFLADHPRVTVDLEGRSSWEIVQSLRDEACDIGVVSDSVEMDGLQTFPFRPDPLTLIVPRGHALAHRRSVCLADAVDLPFVGLVEGHALQDHIAHQAKRLGKPLNYRVRLGSLESVCRLVGLGVGVGVVPQAVVTRCGQSFKVRGIRLTDAWAARHLVVCVRQLNALPLPSQQLVRHILSQQNK
jgi:DNA-binding transcriptional LysR family regulator